jgi:hypothetical protein
VTAPYKLDYEGTDQLVSLDGADPLLRWFKNWRVDKEAQFVSEFEWLTVSERRFAVGRRERARYVGEIGEPDATRGKRKVLFEVGAPPPPTFFRGAAKLRPRAEAKPTRYAGDTMTIETIWEMVARAGLRPPEVDELVRRSRNPWELEDRLRHLMLERARREFEASRWLSPHLMRGVPIGIGIDYGIEGVRPDPPRAAPRVRRNG